MPSPEGPVPTSPPADTDDLPPTQYLVLEVLAARHRLGEQLWTFPSLLKPAMRALVAAGLIGWKSGVEYGTVRAWLTDAGRVAALSESYVPPEVQVRAQVAEELWGEAQRIRREDWPTRVGIAYVNGFEDAVGFLEAAADRQHARTEEDR